MMFSVFRGTKYDDIRPNHTKKTKNNNKNNQNNQKPTHLVFYFLWTGQKIFSPPLTQTKRGQNLGVSEFSTHRDMSLGCGKLPKIKFI